MADLSYGSPELCIFGFRRGRVQRTYADFSFHRNKRSSFLISVIQTRGDKISPERLYPNSRVMLIYSLSLSLIFHFQVNVGYWLDKKIIYCDYQSVCLHVMDVY